MARAREARRRRRRLQHETFDGLPVQQWLHAPIMLALGVGGLVGYITGYGAGVDPDFGTIGTIFFYVMIFLTVFSISRIIGRSLRRANQRRATTSQTGPRPGENAPK